MAEIISLKGIKDFKTVHELKEYTKAQYSTILALTEQLKEAQDKVKHLESLLQGGGAPLLTIDESTFRDRNTGQILCELEIEKIFHKAKSAELSLEDTKRLDLLMKNLYLAKNNTPKKDPEEIDAQLSDDELLKLSGGK